jgi:hypothetical protein
MSAAEILAEGCFFCDEPLPIEVGERAAAADYNPADDVRRFPKVLVPGA